MARAVELAAGAVSHSNVQVIASSFLRRDKDVCPLFTFIVYFLLHSKCSDFSSFGYCIEGHQNPVK